LDQRHQHQARQFVDQSVPWQQHQSCCLSTGRIRHRAAPGNPVSRVDPGQPDQSGPTLPACASLCQHQKP
jgi:hypothetical protein